jgi:cytochrome c556
MVVLAQNKLIENVNKIFLMYENHIVKEKLRLFQKKYSLTFEEFEKKIKQQDQENYEIWDDYIEWKAYNKKYYEDLNV